MVVLSSGSTTMAEVKVDRLRNGASYSNERVHDFVRAVNDTFYHVTYCGVNIHS
jgi:hypothetical protein